MVVVVVVVPYREVVLHRSPFLTYVFSRQMEAKACVLESFDVCIFPRLVSFVRLALHGSMLLWL